MTGSTNTSKRWFHAAMICRRAPALVGFLVASCGFALAAAAQSGPFDHFQTRFPLVGAHERVDCETCHRDGLFAGTPTSCRLCHDGTGRRATTAEDSRHIPIAGLDCDHCHRTRRWQDVRMDHSLVSDRCIDCHNGAITDGLPSRHIASSNDCSSCHRTTTWEHTRVDHDETRGSCSSCHDGVSARGKNRSHITTVEECDLCHSTRRWSPTGFDHSGVTDPCSTCHDGVTATGKSGRHFTTTLECDECHRTSRWSNIDYDHTGGDYPGDHRSRVECDDCHTGNTAAVSYSSPSYQPDCAGCHERDFERDEHRKHRNPNRNYTVSELRDCSGSCHIYTDSSLTTIERRRNRAHRVSDSEFDD